MNNIENEYYRVVVKFCDYFKDNTLNKSNINDFIILMSDIYTKGLLLPYTEPQTVESVNFEHEIPEIKIDFPNFYWETFDPYKDEESVCCDLQDNLAEIIHDLQKGIAEYENGNFSNAVWEWKFGFENHWGYHVVDIIRALHYMR